MAEYIERETMIQAIREYSGFFQDSPSTNHMILKMEAEDVARDLEAADVAPVAHGRWVKEVYRDPYGADWTKYHCSLCGRVEIKKEPYCNCGAKMDVKEG